MDYQALINDSLTTAFKMLYSFQKEATFTMKSEKSFNYETGAVTSTPLTQNLNVIEVSEKTVKTLSGLSDTVVKQIMFETKLLSDIRDFHGVTLNGTQWKISGPIFNDGYITLLELVEEK